VGNHHCGKEISSTTSEDNWEFCQIQATWNTSPFCFNCKCQFWADAIGKKGQYNAGESPIYIVAGNGWRLSNPPTGFSSGGKKKSAEAHNSLVNQLISDGWEPLPDRGQSWWQNRFKRKIR
jgi:hypothetical protein